MANRPPRGLGDYGKQRAASGLTAQQQEGTAYEKALNDTATPRPLFRKLAMSQAPRGLKIAALMSAEFIGE